MAQGTKITFSDGELTAILHPDFFYTKHTAMKKIMELLGETERHLQDIILPYPQLKAHTSTDSPKIFRGENYKLLPYMVLDFPRRFNIETVFAFRTMFWWGKAFSATLHLQGEGLEAFRETIANHISGLKDQEFFYCVNNTPWQYYFEEDNYVPLEMMLEKDYQQIIKAADFIKLSRKIPVNDFDHVPAFASETLSLLLKMLFG